jgi:hypothetical protein
VGGGGVVAGGVVSGVVGGGWSGAKRIGARPVRAESAGELPMARISQGCALARQS